MKSFIHAVILATALVVPLTSFAQLTDLRRVPKCLLS